MDPDTQNKPFLERPDETQPEADQAFCFLDASRPCTAECMAFLPARPEGADYEGQTWSACMLLVNLHKMGKHHVALAQQGAAFLKNQKIHLADAQRSNQPLPPKVT